MSGKVKPPTCVEFRGLLERAFAHNTGPVIQDAIRLLSYRYMLSWPDEKFACVAAIATDIAEAETKQT